MQGEQTLFSKALLDCLNGDAGVFKEFDGADRWQVSVHSLAEALKVKVEDWNETLGAEQYFTFGGQAPEAVVCFLEGTPSVEVVFFVEPVEALDLTKVVILDGAGVPLADIPMPLKPHPWRVRWPAGFYAISASVAPGNHQYVDMPRTPALLSPPRKRRMVRVR